MAVWLVTGATSGFGLEIVRHALAIGDSVVVTARDPSKLPDLGAPDRVQRLALDVTDQGSIDRAVAEAETRFGRIDVLVNNAGYALIAAAEEASDAETRTLMETHFFGALALIRAVLPGMRARRSGHIVNFSSTGGITSGAGSALYSAAKFAIEGLSEGLAAELAPLGIKVTIIEPGPFQTRFFSSSLNVSERTIADYDETARAILHRFADRKDVVLPGDPTLAAQVIATIVADPDPPLRLLLGGPAYHIITAKLRAHLDEIERWKELSLSADRPEARGQPWG